MNSLPEPPVLEHSRTLTCPEAQNTIRNKIRMSPLLVTLSWVLISTSVGYSGEGMHGRSIRNLTNKIRTSPILVKFSSTRATLPK